MSYKAPLKQIKHCLENIIGVEHIYSKGVFAEIDSDLAGQILEEGAKFSEEILAPTNAKADKEPAILDENRNVKISPSFHAPYKSYIEGGWAGMSFPQEYGGMGLPYSLTLAVSETIYSANMSFGLGPMLSSGVIEALIAHGTDAQKQEFLPYLISGEWTGTMNLTEPHAGSDVGALTTKAIKQEDGTYKIYGQKIFITWGDHDLTPNILHLVLARLPDAPSGAKGISLFLVPKFLKDENGDYKIRNDVGCIGLEHKLGIHASPTCVMSYGDGLFGDEKGAIGYLVGEENKGLNAMFTMMNMARLFVGLQGVAIADRALQKAVYFANERRQGKAFDDESVGSSLIIKHPDVKRMLMMMQAKTDAARAICLLNAFAIDNKENAQTQEERQSWALLEGILTPISKSWSTDIGVEVASLGLQIHGGMGFIEETGAAQYYRDARIAPIYEGTNGIQAIDLIGRKLAFDNGKAFGLLCDMMLEIADKAIANKDLGAMGDELKNIISQTRIVSIEIIEWQKGDKKNNALAAANCFLNLLGNVLGASLLLKGVIMLISKDTDDLIFKNNQIALCKFFFANVLSEAPSQLSKINFGYEGLFDYDFSQT